MATASASVGDDLASEVMTRGGPGGSMTFLDEHFGVSPGRAERRSGRLVLRPKHQGIPERINRVRRPSTMASDKRMGPMEMPSPLNSKELGPDGAIEKIDAKDVG